jgi:hypothetical protein
MLRKILPNSPIARLYVGTYAVLATVSLSATVASMAATRVFGR